MLEGLLLGNAAVGSGQATHARVMHHPTPPTDLGIVSKTREPVVKYS